MKLFRKVWLPGLVFVISVLVAAFTGLWSAADGPGRRVIPRSQRGEMRTEEEPVPPEVFLPKLEREIFAEVESRHSRYSAEGMEQTPPLNDGNYASGDGYSQEWANQSPEEMFAWLQRRGTPLGVWNADYAMAFGSWAKKDMEKALAAVPTISARADRAAALACCLEELWKSQPERAKELLLENRKLLFPPGGATFRVWSGSLGWEMVLSLPAGEERTAAMAESLGNTGREQGDLAVEMWEKLPEHSCRELVAAGFDGGGPEFPRLEAMRREQVEATGDSRKAASFIGKYGEAWAARDFGGAVEWAAAWLKGSERVDRCMQLFYRVEDGRFGEAAAVCQNLPGGTLKGRAAGTLAARATEGNREKAALLIESLSPHDRRVAERERDDAR